LNQFKVFAKTNTESLIQDGTGIQHKIKHNGSAPILWEPGLEGYPCGFRCVALGLCPAQPLRNTAKEQKNSKNFHIIA